MTSFCRLQRIFYYYYKYTTFNTLNIYLHLARYERMLGMWEFVRLLYK